MASIKNLIISTTKGQTRILTKKISKVYWEYQMNN